MASPKAAIESILFVSAKPVSAKKLAELSGAQLSQVRAIVEELMQEYAPEQGGVQLNRLGDSYQFSTTPETTAVTQAYLDEDEKKELTKPSLETLTIIAYRGPISKAELELIRGVNCTLILRNLLIRGLIEEQEDAVAMITRYQVTFDFLQYLGLREPAELPNYQALNSDENLQTLLRELQAEKGEATDSDDVGNAEEVVTAASDAVLDEDEEEDEDDDEDDETLSVSTNRAERDDEEDDE